MLGVSVDSFPANAAFAKQEGLNFPLLSDFKRTVSKEYGILNEEQQFANRTTFVIDMDGKIVNIDEGKEALDPTGAATACSRLSHRSK